CALSAPGAIVALAAASAGVGAEVCLYPTDLDDDQVSSFAMTFGHPTVVVHRTRRLVSIETLTLDQLMLTGDMAFPSPERTPVMILTTGTTGAPKGARHDWSRLARAVRAPDERPATRWLLAYNLNQFAGVQILLHVLASAGTLVAPPSRRADDVLGAIERHRVTHVSGTPTFWRLIVGRLDEE